MGRWANKFVIGLTGNIAMGKSVVRKMLEHLGAYTIDADGLAHQTMVPGAPAYQPVVETFGKWILDPDGKINRSKLGAVAFSHPEALTRLEAITHPFVGRGIDTLIQRATQPVVVVEAIKLIEGPLGGQVDSIWVVDSTPEVQIKRLMSRNNMPEVEARKRIEGQNSQREKMTRAHVVIANNGTLQDVWGQVEREFKRSLEGRGLKPADQQDDRVGTVKVRQPAVPVPPAQPATSVPVPPAQPPSATTPTPRAPSSTGSLGPLPALRTGSTQPMQPISPQQASQPPVAPPPSSGNIPAPKVTTQTAAQVPTPPPAQPAQPAQPANPATKRSTQPAPAVPSQFTGEVSVEIRRGMPKTADIIAQMVNAATGKRLNRMDIMTLFGEKSYLLAEVANRPYGLAGFQVENLITRLDEFLIAPEAPTSIIAQALIQSVEDASKELQSEVGFVYLPTNVNSQVILAFTSNGYERTELDSIKVPAWREAAQESQPPNTIIFAKKLRAERVLKPL